VLVVINGVVALSSHDEVGGNELGALVKKLVERVLGVGSRLAEKDGSGSIFDVVATAGNGLSVGLHGQLLEVSWEPVKILIEAVLTVREIVPSSKASLTVKRDVSARRRSLSTRHLADRRLPECSSPGESP
jgi:hypothetical protein